MPISSYLAFPAPGHAQDLHAELEAIPGCMVLPSSGGEVAILVTDSADEDEERELQERLRSAEHLLSLALVYARTEQGIATAWLADPPEAVGRERGRC